MKHSLITIIFLSLIINISTAQKDKSKEVGIGISLIDFPNSFSLAYKLQKTETRWFRLNAVIGSVQFQRELDLPDNTPTITPLSSSFGLSLGVEKRKTFNRVDILRGPQFDMGFAMTAILRDDNIDTDPVVGLYGGLSYLFGVQVHIKNNMKIGIETLPGVTVSYVNDASKTLDFNLGFNSNALNLFIVYQFSGGKEKE